MQMQVQNTHRPAGAPSLGDELRDMSPLLNGSCYNPWNKSTLICKKYLLATRDLQILIPT